MDRAIWDWVRVPLMRPQTLQPALSLLPHNMAVDQRPTSGSWSSSRLVLTVKLRCSSLPPTDNWDEAAVVWAAACLRSNRAGNELD